MVNRQPEAAEIDDIYIVKSPMEIVFCIAEYATTEYNVKVCITDVSDETPLSKKRVDKVF